MKRINAPDKIIVNIVNTPFPYLTKWGTCIMTMVIAVLTVICYFIPCMSPISGLVMLENDNYVIKCKERSGIIQGESITISWLNQTGYRENSIVKIVSVTPSTDSTSKYTIKVLWDAQHFEYIKKNRCTITLTGEKYLGQYILGSLKKIFRTTSTLSTK